MKTLTLRLDDEDHKLFALLADADDLPVATFIRRVIRQLAREKGLLAAAQPANNPATQTPAAPSTPMRDSMFTREALLKRVEAGEQLREVAASVGIQVSELQARLAQAKTARADGSLHREQGREAFKRDNPKPDDGKDYSAHAARNPANPDGWDYSWQERVIADPTAPQPTRALTPEEETERTNELGRKAELWYEGTPVQVAPRRVDPNAAAMLDDIFS